MNWNGNFRLFNRVYASKLGVFKINDTLLRKRNYCRIIESGLGFQIRNITENDLPKIAETRKTLKIHDCLSSLKSFHKQDPDAIILAENDNGQIIGTHMIINYASDIYSSGITYVHPDYRFLGIAKKMLVALRPRHEGHCLVTHTYQAWAKRAGKDITMKIQTDFTFKRHITDGNVDYNILADNLPSGASIHMFEDRFLDIINNYDSKLMGYDRRRFLELNCKEENSVTAVALKDGICAGYGTIKLSCLGASRVGPLYADDANIAEILLKALLKRFPGVTGFTMTVPNTNVAANEFMKKLEVPFNDELIQAVDRELPKVDMNKVFAHFDLNGTAL